MLCFISLALLLVRLIYPNFIEPDNILIENLPFIERKHDSVYLSTSKQFSGRAMEQNTSGKKFAFDPNTVSAHQLVDLGFSEKTAGILIKFRSKGFVFRKKEDLKKVYGVSEKLYSKLEPYIIIQKLESKSGVPVLGIVPESKAIELNSADSLQLIALNGIGPSFAKRILKYKQLLGGYLKAEQLKEVYGFTEEMYLKISPLVKVNSTLVTKLDLNTDDFKTINKHPYLTYELTKDICNKRRAGIIDADNLKEIITDKNIYDKILPYLNFN